MKQRMLPLLLLVMVLVTRFSTSATTNQDEVTKQLLRLQIQIQGFQAHLTEQLNIQRMQTGAMEKRLDNELKAMQTETSSMKTLIKVLQSDLASARIESHQQTQCCLETRKYIATLLSTPTDKPNTSPTPAALCPNGYSKFEDSCYKVKGNPSHSFQSALDQCKLEGTHLVAIETEKENNFLKRLVTVTAGYGAHLWTGGNDRAKERDWRWQSTGTKIEYTNWHKGEPSQKIYRNHDDCICMHGDDNFEWYDESCTRTDRGYICELQLV